NPQFVCRLFVQLAAHDKSKNLALPVRQRCIAVLDVREFRALLKFIPADGEGVFDLRHQLRFAERFGQKTDRAGFDGAHGRGNIPVSRDEHDGQEDAVLHEKILHVQSIEAGEIHVQHEARDLDIDVLLEKLFRRSERFHAVPPQLEKTVEPLADGVIVVHHENGWSVRNHNFPFPKTGSTTRNVTPFSGLLATEILPPCNSTMERQMASPMPRPSVLVVKNGSKMRSIWPSGMPGPVSRTRMATWSLPIIDVSRVNSRL